MKTASLQQLLLLLLAAGAANAANLREQIQGALQAATGTPLNMPHKSNPDQDAKWWLLAHNQLRCYHGVGELKWDSAGAAEMQTFVNFLKTQGIMRHVRSGDPGSSTTGLGAENLHSGSMAIESQTLSYYSEIKLCKDMPGCQTGLKSNGWVEIGHMFNQLNPTHDHMACACADTCGCRFGRHDTTFPEWDRNIPAVNPDLVVACDTKYKRLYEEAGNAVAWTPFQHVPHYRDTYDTTKVLALPAPEKRTFPGCTDKANWRDDNGRTCKDYYERFSNVCSDYGAIYNHMGTPNDSCCVCAYKLAPTASPTASPTPASKCEDTANWHLQSGSTFNCDWLTSSESNCKTYGTWSGAGSFRSGNEECCKCKWLQSGMTWQQVLAQAAGSSPSPSPPAPAPSPTPSTKCTDTPGFYFWRADFNCAWFATNPAFNCGNWGPSALPAENGIANEKCCACKALLGR